MEERNRIRIDTDGRPEEAMRIHVAIRMLVPPRKYKEACRSLGSMVERIKVKEGCLGCHLYQEAVGGKMLLFEMIWADEKSFQTHLESEEFRYVLMVVEMASSPPEVHFDRVAHSTRINTIEDVWKWTDALRGRSVSASSSRGGDRPRMTSSTGPRGSSAI